MSLNIDAFIYNYPFEPKIKGIDFEGLKAGSQIPRPYFTATGTPILVTMTEHKVDITPNGLYGDIRLFGAMKNSSTVEFIYKTRHFEEATPFPDLYAKYFVTALIGFLDANGNRITNWFEEWNQGSTNYIRYVGAILGGLDPVTAIGHSWGSEQALIRGFSKKKLLSPEKAWMTGSKIQVLYSR